MCTCQTWCRTWQETEDGKYPHSDHAPGCEDYKTERFVRVVYDGTHCIVEPYDVEALIGDGEGYEISDVMLTRDQYKRMPEFDGF